MALGKLWGKFWLTWSGFALGGLDRRSGFVIPGANHQELSPSLPSRQNAQSHSAEQSPNACQTSSARHQTQPVLHNHPGDTRLPQICSGLGTFAELLRNGPLSIKSDFKFSLCVTFYRKHPCVACHARPDFYTLQLFRCSSGLEYCTWFLVWRRGLWITL